MTTWPFHPTSSSSLADQPRGTHRPPPWYTHIGGDLRKLQAATAPAWSCLRRAVTAAQAGSPLRQLTTSSYHPRREPGARSGYCVSKNTHHTLRFFCGYCVEICAAQVAHRFTTDCRSFVASTASRDSAETHHGIPLGESITEQVAQRWFFFNGIYNLAGLLHLRSPTCVKGEQKQWRIWGENHSRLAEKNAAFGKNCH